MIQRLRFALGTTGIGFVTFNPATANDTLCLTSTTSTSVGGSATAFSAFTNLTTSNFTSMPYTTASHTANLVLSRVVAYGIRIGNVQNLMNRGGIVFAFEHPDHVDVMSQTLDSVGAMQYTARDRVSSEPGWDSDVLYSGPTTPADLEFQAAAMPLNNSAGARVAVLAVSGTAGDVYEAEVCVHVEYIGTNAAGRTPSHSDVENSGKVLEVVKTTAGTKPLQKADQPGVLDRIRDAITEAAPVIMQGGAMIKSILSADFSSFLENGIRLASNSLVQDKLNGSHTPGLMGVGRPRQILYKGA